MSLCHFQPVLPSGKDVGYHRLDAGILHQHDRLLLQYVPPSPKVTQSWSSCDDNKHSPYVLIATSGINIATDLWILGLPIKTLQLANRPVKEIIALGFIFGAGILATILSCIRLQSIYVYTLATDPFRDGIPVCAHTYPP